MSLNCVGQLVSTKRVDLDHILDHFEIQVRFVLFLKFSRDIFNSHAKIFLLEFAFDFIRFCLIVWLIRYDWLIDWFAMIDWLIDWLIWLIDWLIDWFFIYWSLSCPGLRTCCIDSVICRWTILFISWIKTPVEVFSTRKREKNCIRYVSCFNNLWPGLKIRCASGAKFRFFAVFLQSTITGWNGKGDRGYTTAGGRSSWRCGSKRRCQWKAFSPR